MHCNRLKDPVKGFLSPHGDFDPFLDLSHLKVYVAIPEYLLALKCAAMRIREGYRDLDDVRYLLRYLNIETYSAALAIITRYITLEQLPQKTLNALEELLGC